MEGIDQVLALLDKLGATESETIAKIILLILTFFASIYGAIWKRKARRRAADNQRQRDRIDNVSDNNRDEDQNSRDGISVRDRLK
jgi:hypothetical protein